MTMIEGKLSYDGLCARMKSDVTAQWREVTSHDTEVQPRIYLYRKQTLHRSDIPFDWFASRDGKNELFARIAYAAKLGDCSMVGVTNSVMALQLDPASLTPEEAEEMERTNEFPKSVMKGYANLTEHPDAVEWQQALCVDREIGKAQVAEVDRKPGRPARLKAWNTVPMDGGLMYEPIQAALR